jgi:hypothetical protein
VPRNADDCAVGKAFTFFVVMTQDRAGGLGSNFHCILNMARVSRTVQKTPNVDAVVWSTAMCVWRWQLLLDRRS